MRAVPVLSALEDELMECSILSLLGRVTYLRIVYGDLDVSRFCLQLTHLTVKWAPPPE